jgi:hypothetical protein
MGSCFSKELLTMNHTEPVYPEISNDKPRRPYQEIADLLATALLRLHQTVRLESDTTAPKAELGLGFCGEQSVNGNAHHTQGVRQ